MSEVRTVSSLALLYAFRMLGLFMVLPVLMLYGDQYEGASPALLGLALGVYGLTQAVFQVPLGLLSDMFGRKPIIILGLVVFAVGSWVAAEASAIEGLILGRALQGSGAIASALMAMVADLTSEQNRTKAMAAIGASIGLSFSAAMILGPALASSSGLSGVFFLSTGLACVGVAIIAFLVPTPPTLLKHRDVMTSPALVLNTLKDNGLLRLDWGIFSLHCILMANFVAVPLHLEQTLGLSRESHWWFYLPVLIGAFLVMLPAMLYAEKKQRIKPVFISAVGVLLLSSFCLVFFGSSAYWLVACIFTFFVAFNLLEAMLPSLVSKLAPAGAKGTAMGLYSTCQFLGAFVGGAVGGGLLNAYALPAVFIFTSIIAAGWFCVALFMRSPRHLASVCLQLQGCFDRDALLRINGVKEVFVSPGDILVYLKVDRAVLDEEALEHFSVKYGVQA